MKPQGDGRVRCSAWLGGLRYFVLSGPIPPTTVYRLQPSGELEMMISCGWTASVTNQMTGLHELSEGAARFIWERLFQPPNGPSSATASKDGEK